MTQPLRSGDAGVAQTIRLMRDVIDAGVTDKDLNERVIDVLRAAGVGNFDKAAKAQAIYDWVSANFLYVEDPVGPFGPKETVRTIRAMLRRPAGDCDDYTSFLAAALGTAGIAARAVTVASDPSAPNDFSHIYPEAEVSPGNWIAMDAARPGAQFGLAPQRFNRKRVWSLTDNSYRDIGCACRTDCGERVSSLAGYALLGKGHLGQDPNVAAQDISAVGQATANIIAAAQGSPFAAFQTAYSPVAPAAGYGNTGFYGPGYPGAGSPTGITATLAGSSAIWWILGIGAVALALGRSRK